MSRNYSLNLIVHKLCMHTPSLPMIQMHNLHSDSRSFLQPSRFLEAGCENERPQGDIYYHDADGLMLITAVVVDSTPGAVST